MSIDFNLSIPLCKQGNGNIVISHGKRKECHKKQLMLTGITKIKNKSIYSSRTDFIKVVYNKINKNAEIISLQSFFSQCVDVDFLCCCPYTMLKTEYRLAWDYQLK